MAYIFLTLAILGELLGTTLLKYSEGFTKILPSLGSIISYSICFLFFAKSLQSIKLGVAYATWSGVGIIAATLLSFLLFHEKINTIGIIGIALIIIGVVMLNLFGSSNI